MPGAVWKTYRSLIKRPAFFCAVVLTLTLGIGANSAIFSVIDAVLLKPLPYPRSDRLMALYESSARNQVPRGPVAPVRVEEWNRMNRTFTAIAGAYTENVAETSGELPAMLVSARVSARFFSVLETPLLIGRPFGPEEDLMDGPNAAVISERLWRKRFGADPNVLGKRLLARRSTYPIVGVAPVSLQFPAPAVDFWVPAKLPDVVMRSRGARFDSVVGRLKENASVEAAQADLAAVQGRLALQFPGTDRDWNTVVEPLKEQQVAGIRRSLWILFGAVSLVLLIACSNVACLLLAQASRRERDIAVRLSLGARRTRVIRELLLESLCLAVPGAVLGLGLSMLGASLFRRAAALLPRADVIHLDWRIVTFTLSLSLLTTVLFGLLPALRATRTEIASVLSGGSRTQIGNRHAVERALVSTQIALAVVLLIGSGLLIRSLSRLGQVSLGFDPDHVLAFRVSATWREKEDMGRVAQRFHRTLDAVRGIPGAQAAALSIDMPGAGDPSPVEIHISGRDTDSQGEKLLADSDTVAPDYFQVLGIPMLAGHTCRLSFDPKSPPSVLVSNSFAQRYFSDRSPLGEHILVESGTPFEIIGVVGDVRKHGFAKDPVPTIYACRLPGFYPDPQYLLRATGDPLRLAEAVRQKIHEIEPNRAVFQVTRLSDAISTSLTPRRFQVLLLVSFAATALLLAAIGLYGVTSFLVSQRTREIGLRVALGARPTQIFLQVFRQAAGMTALGVAAGLLASTALSQSIASLLFGVAAMDPLTFVVVPIALALIAALATWAPARRATRVDPMEALRQE